MKAKIYLASICMALAAGAAQAQLLTDFESFTAPGANGGILFRSPNMSGSTGAKIQPAPSPLISQVVNSGVPAGNPNTGNNALWVSYNFVDTGGAPLWLRLTTFNAAILGNPTLPLDANSGLKFDIWSDHALYVAPIIRETETGAAFGANGGASGSLEFLGGNPASATGDRGLFVPAGAWASLFFEFQNTSATPVFGFTGNGVLDVGVDGKGVLDALGLAFDDLPGNRDADINIWLDNVSVTAVPEPSVIAILSLGLGLLVCRRICRH